MIQNDEIIMKLAQTNVNNMYLSFTLRWQQGQIQRILQIWNHKPASS